MNKAKTRAEHIDPALKDAGCWGVVNGKRQHLRLLRRAGLHARRQTDCRASSDEWIRTTDTRLMKPLL